MSKHLHVPERLAGQAAFDKIQSRISAHQEYAYRVFEGFEFGSIDLTQSIFTGSLWRKIQASKTDFSRCDFDGMQIEGCVFAHANFANADIRSTAVVGCKFLDCSFEGALLDTCSFDGCIFDRCTFDGSAHRACRFSNCDLLNYSLVRSSFTKCWIGKSRLAGLTLADCRFMYVIVRHCAFSDVTINLESIGTVYGITPNDLPNLKFIFLGNEAIPANSTELAALLETSFSTQRWTLSLAITRLNFSLTATAFAIAEYLRDVNDQRAAGRLLRQEEIEFLLEVFGILLEEGRLPLVSISQLGEVLQEAHELIDGTSAHGQLAAETLGTLQTRTAKLAQTTLERLAEAIGRVDFADQTPVLMQFIFEVEPSLDLSSLLADATMAAGLTACRPPERVSTKQGSYIEVIQASVETAFALRIFLYALNGILIQLTEMKERIKVLRQHRAPRQFELLAKSNHQPLPASLRLPIRKLVNFAAVGDWMRKPDLKGIDDRNLRKVQVEPSSPEKNEEAGT